jgi:lysophospholipase L1-like esterase
VTDRVPPEAYRSNLETLVARVRGSGAEAWLLAFPMREPPAAHLAVLREMSTKVRVIEPSLPADAFFAEDPIHLTPDGNRELAAEVATALRGAT